jgi:hypothetical protein
LIDVLESQPPAAQAITSSRASPALSLKSAIDAIPEDHLKHVLRVLTNDVAGDVDKMRSNIEQWYNDTMDRVSGWYKRKVQIILLIISLIVSVGLGIDTIALGNTLWQNSTLRAAVVTAAQQQTRSAVANGHNQLPSQIKTLQVDLNQLNVPIGYSVRSGDPTYITPNLAGWLRKALGLLLTTIALSLGAPFWFDLLNNVVNLRQTGPKPDSAS